MVDDASIDDTAASVLRHAEEDPRISLVRRDGNVGLAAARNTGIASARGEFITFLDADDFMFPNTLGTRLSAARTPGERIAGSWCDWASVAENVGLEFQPSRPGRFDTIDYETGGGENQVISTSPMVRTEVLRSLGGYDDEFRTAEDFEFATRLFRNGFQLAFAPVVGVAYRQKRTSMIAGDPAGHARNAMRIYDYMSRPLDELAKSELATSPYVESPAGIPSAVKRLERLITFLTFAVLSDEDEQRKGVYGLLPEGLLGPSTFLVDVESRIDGAIRRHATRSAGIGKAERTRVETTVRALLAERGVDPAPASGITPHFGRIDRKRIEALPPARSRVRPARALDTAGTWDVLLYADSSDAARELLLVGRELAEVGLRVAMADLSSADQRRAMNFESVFRVADPLGSARLLISSRGQEVDADVERHLVISCEDAPLTSIGAGEFAHLRGRWESSGADDRVIGWHTRRDRIARAVAPVAGQAVRGRTAHIVVAGSPDAEHSASSLLEACTGFELVFDPAFNAGVSRTLAASTLRKIAPYVHAVIVVGDRPAPADALAYGTPVLRLGGQTQPHDTTVAGSAVLERISACVPSVVAEGELEDDPLAAHVARAIEMLAS